MRRLAVFLLLLGSVVGCAGRSQYPDSGGGGDVTGRMSPGGAPNALVDVSPSYRRIGRLASSGTMPFIGTVTFAAGPGDSVTGMIGLSLENRAFAFQRDGGAFIARYRVTLSLQPKEGQGPPIALSREEVVRVASFAETQRTDESVLFQQSLRLRAGAYHVTATVRDLGSTSEGQAQQEFVAPSFGPGTTTEPILVYQATGRGTPTDPLSVVLNSRGTIAYGADTLVAYVEGYNYPGPTTVPFEVRDEEKTTIFRDSLRFHGGKPVESQVIRIPPDSVVLGQVKLVAGPAGRERSSVALVSFSQAWVAASFDEVVDMLRYFPNDDEVAKLRKAPASGRARAWHDFYHKTDPDPSTPENEALTEYLGRVTSANRLFNDEGIAGWQTDRGEVYINLGPPDDAAETGPGRTRVVRWVYINQRLTLFFQDEGGFGRLRLTPGSRSDYERAALRTRKSR